MSDTSLAEVVKQLEGERLESGRLESAVTSVDTSDAPSSLREDLFEGLRATEWLLSDLRERCRQLHGYRLRLIDKLQQLEDGVSFDDAELADDSFPQGIVPGPVAVQ